MENVASVSDKQSPVLGFLEHPKLNSTIKRQYKKPQTAYQMLNVH